MEFPTFSPDLRQELALALQEYATRRGPADGKRLQAATDRICTEAHNLGMAPERMVVALKAFYDGLPRSTSIADRRQRTAFDRLLYGCLYTYYAAAEKPAL